jgi:hypothetical protein
MASRDYCSGASMELGFLLGKLQKLSMNIDHIPSIDKYKMLPQIQALNIIIAELDDRICEMVASCSTVDMPNQDGAYNLPTSETIKFQKNSSEHFDYDFGG